ncbi:hypothetical protein C8R44DRAFT_747238 [Mycena epipterygia]|nr:hypothetical protein C8R44DRAFT_747238 [Mycena epipterygia]
MNARKELKEQACIRTSLKNAFGYGGVLSRRKERHVVAWKRQRSAVALDSEEEDTIAREERSAITQGGGEAPSCEARKRGAVMRNEEEGAVAHEERTPLREEVRKRRWGGEAPSREMKRRAPSRVRRVSSRGGEEEERRRTRRGEALLYEVRRRAPSREEEMRRRSAVARGEGLSHPQRVRKERAASLHIRATEWKRRRCAKGAEAMLRRRTRYPRPPEGTVFGSPDRGASPLPHRSPFHFTRLSTLAANIQTRGR